MCIRDRYICVYLVIIFKEKFPINCLLISKVWAGIHNRKLQQKDVKKKIFYVNLNISFMSVYIIQTQ